MVMQAWSTGVTRMFDWTVCLLPGVSGPESPRPDGQCTLLQLLRRFRLWSVSSFHSQMVHGATSKNSCLQGRDD